MSRKHSFLGQISPAQFEEGTQQPNPKLHEEGTMTVSFALLALVLGVVALIALIALVSWLVRKAGEN